MRTSSAVVLAVCLSGSVASLGADRRSFEFSEVVVPGAVLTNAQGINAAGDIVGFYRNATGAHGFLLRKGEVTTIDFPGAAATNARGISPDGQIVGTYTIAGEPSVNVHGFLLDRDGTFSRVDYPNHTSTIPQRILPDGTILGCRHDTDTMETMHGVRIRADGTSDETEVSATMHNGATPDGGLIVGLFTDMMTGRGEGYVIEDGTFTPFVVPGSKFTAAWDVNPRGEIAGVYQDSANRFHGFVRDGDDYVALDVPGANATRAFGINAGGDVVGAFVDAAGRTRAFIATRTRK
jgi:uncharacterized membrane protein